MTHGDGFFTVTGARFGVNGEHDSFGERRLDEQTLIAWIVRVFRQHYRERGHSLDRAPVVEAAA